MVKRLNSTAENYNFRAPITGKRIEKIKQIKSNEWNVSTERAQMTLGTTATVTSSYINQISYPATNIQIFSDYPVTPPELELS